MDELDNVLSLYNRIQVHRSTTGILGVYTEITTPTTRIVLVAGQDLYTFDDTAGSPAFFYKTRYLHSTTLLESDFSDPIQGTTGGYVSLQEARDVGVPSSISDSALEQIVAMAQQLIEQATRQWFEPRADTFLLDGDDSDTLFLGVPIISITDLFVNNVFDTSVPRDAFHVYNSRNYPDDRKNPKIKLILGERMLDVFLPPTLRDRGGLFAFGHQNQKVGGTFGYVEKDGSTPFLIKRALLKLILRYAETGKGLAGSTFLGIAGGQLAKEQVDRHSLWFYPSFRPMNKRGLMHLTGDPEVDEIMNLYRAPMAIGAPRSKKYFFG